MMAPCSGRSTSGESWTHPFRSLPNHRRCRRQHRCRDALPVAPARVGIENPAGETDGYRAIEHADGAIDAIGVEELLDEARLKTLDLLKMDIDRVIRAGHYRVTRSGEYHLLSRP